MHIPTVAKTPSRLVVCRRLGNRRVTRARGALKVQALFGRSAPSAPAGKSKEQVAQLVSIAKRFRAPSEAGNEAIAELAGALLKLNQKNPKSPAINGKWNILYASGQSGLTALPGQISSFKVTPQGYESECTTKTLGVFGGYAREGGTLKATGGDTFELIQEYVEIKNGPGPVLEEESVDAPVRTFQVLYLDNDVLALRLKTTRYKDENGRMQTVTPDDDYFLVWQKEGAAMPRVSAARASVDVEEEEDEEEEEAPKPPFSLFGFGTSVIKKQAGLATIAERSYAGSQGTEVVQDRRAAQQQAAEAKRQQAEERKRAQAEAAAERKRAQEEAAAERRRAQQEAAEERRRAAEERKQAAQAARQQRSASTSEEKPKGGTGFINIFAPKPQAEPEPAKQAPAPKKAGGLFAPRAKAAAPAEDPAAARRAAAEQRRQEQLAAAEARRQEAEERKAAAARAAEERRQAAAAAAEAKRREVEERKAEAERARAEQAAAKEREDALRAKIKDALDGFSESLTDASGKVRELQNSLRTAQRDGKDAMRAGDNARKQLSKAEDTFETAEANLEEANSAYNQLVGQMREKSAELQAAEKKVAELEKAML